MSLIFFRLDGWGGWDGWDSWDSWGGWDAWGGLECSDGSGGSFLNYLVSRFLVSRVTILLDS